MSTGDLALTEVNVHSVIHTGGRDDRMTETQGSGARAPSATAEAVPEGVETTGMQTVAADLRGKSAARRHTTRRLRRLPPHRGLTRATEHDLLLEARTGQADARGVLVEAFLPRVAGTARPYRNLPSVSHGELMQAGVVGLLRALERYDLDADTPFWAYASWWVRRAMQQLVAELARPVVLSDRAMRDLARLRGARLDHLQSGGGEPTMPQLAAESGLPLPEVEQLRAAEDVPRSLDEALGDDAPDTVGDLVADPRAEDAYDRVERRLSCAQLGALLTVLTARQRRVVMARYGVGGRRKTLHELGDSLGLTAERIRQIELVALVKLQDAAARAGGELPLA
jgi:RNA polymerase primary sigma factor